MGAPEALPTYVYFVYFIYRRFLVYFLYGPVIFRSGFFRIHNVSFIFSLMGFKNVSFYFFFCPRLPFFYMYFYALLAFLLFLCMPFMFAYSAFSLWVLCIFRGFSQVKQNNDDDDYNNSSSLSTQRLCTKNSQQNANAIN